MCFHIEALDDFADDLLKLKRMIKPHFMITIMPKINTETPFEHTTNI